MPCASDETGPRRSSPERECNIAQQEISLRPSERSRSNDPKFQCTTSLKGQHDEMSREQRRSIRMKEQPTRNRQNRQNIYLTVWQWTKILDSPLRFKLLDRHVNHCRGLENPAEQAENSDTYTSSYVYNPNISIQPLPSQSSHRLHDRSMPG